MFIICKLTARREGLQLLCSNLDIFKIRDCFTLLCTKFEMVLKSRDLFAGSSTRYIQTIL